MTQKKTQKKKIRTPHLMVIFLIIYKIISTLNIIKIILNKLKNFHPGLNFNMIDSS